MTLPVAIHDQLDAEVAGDAKVVENKHHVQAVFELCRQMLDSIADEILLETVHKLRLTSRNCKIHFDEGPIDNWELPQDYYVWKRFEGSPLTLGINWFPYAPGFGASLSLGDDSPLIIIGKEADAGYPSSRWTGLLIPSTIETLVSTFPSQKKELERLLKQWDKLFNTSQRQLVFCDLTAPQEPVRGALRTVLGHIRLVLDAIGPAIFSADSPILVPAPKAKRKR